MPKLVSDGLTASEFQAIKSSSGASGSANSGPKIQITCENLSIEVGRDVKSRKLALTNVNATFGASKLTALMGPSGAGKTTLLNCLTGVGKITGEIMFNGAPRPKNFIAMCAVIPQEDTLYGALTPRETFTYVARLRLGDSVPKEEKVAAAEAMLKRLELTKCADTPVGNEDIRGVSGGEKKRTSIGCELIVNPAVLFVDEPTSGLDSKMARSVIEILQSLAHDEGRTVITVIHQPSWRIFSLFDSLVLLKDGQVVFQGPVPEVQGYFSGLGFEAPPHENPMDYYFDVLQESQKGDDNDKNNSGSSSSSSDSSKKSITDGSDPDRAEKLKDPAFFAKAWAEHDGSVDATAKLALNAHAMGNASDVEAAAAAAAEASGRTSLWSQFCTLTERCTTDYVKDKTKLMGGIGLKASVGILFGIIWLNQGRGDKTQSKIFTVEGPMFFCCFSAVFDTLFGFIIKYPLTRALIQREFRNRYYAVGPYFFAELLSRSFFEAINAIILGVPAYLLVGLELSAPQLLIFLTVVAMLSVLGAALGILVGTHAKDIQEAQGMIIPVLMPLMLFSGFFLPYEEIPFFFRWLYEISFLRYAFNVLKMNQWQDVTFDDCSPEGDVALCQSACYVNGEAYLEATGAADLSIATNFLVLLGFMAAGAIFSFVSMRAAIHKKAKQG